MAGADRLSVVIGDVGEAKGFGCRPRRSLGFMPSIHFVVYPRGVTRPATGLTDWARSMSARTPDRYASLSRLVRNVVGAVAIFPSTR
jgi:hypothetical protein